MEFVLAIPPRGVLPRPALIDDNEQVVELVSHYLKTLTESAQGYSLQTIKLYGSNLRYLCEWISAQPSYKGMPLDFVLRTMPTGVVNQYLSFAKRAGLSDATSKNRDITYKGFFEWTTSADAGYARKDSGYEVRCNIRTVRRRKKPRFVTKEQAIKLINSLYSESQRCLVHFLYDSGLRVSEIPRVKKTDIDLLDDWPEELAYLPLLVRGSKGRGGGNVKERYVLISRAIFERIKRYHNSREYLYSGWASHDYAFLNTFRRPITSKAIQKAIASAASRAGFMRGVISPHRLRHGTALSILLGDDGKDYLEKLVVIQTQLGHADIRTTEIYTCISPALFTKMNGGQLAKARFQEAQSVYEQTFQPARLKRDMRGRPRKC